MTERRPHWDDDLVNAVIDLQYHCVDCMEDDYPEIDPINHDAVNAAWAHEIIATVEDWHKAKRDSRDRTHGTTSDGEPYCESCGVCDEGWRCRCCLAAEVEALRAQVQAVREFCAATNPIRGELHMAALHGWDTAMEMVLQLLESGEIKGFTFRIANLEGRVDD